MLIRTYTTKSEFNRSRLHVELQCDTCLNQFVSNRRAYLKKEHHWCSVICTNVAMKDGGHLHQKMKQTWRNNHNAEHPMRTQAVRDKHQQTCQARHGVGSPLQIPHVRVASQTLESYAKKHRTHKRNGTYRQSYVETHFYNMLVSRFGIDDVERQKRPEGTAWPIDFYVKSLDTWIQVDGIYWHGLDGQLEEHRKRASVDKRSRIIAYKWEIDRRQERWFAERGMRLLRFTDVEIKSMKELPEMSPFLLRIPEPA